MDIDHSLCIGIAKVGLMGWAVVDLEQTLGSGRYSNFD